MRASGKWAVRVSSTRWVPWPTEIRSTLPQLGQESGMFSSWPQWWQRRVRSRKCTTSLVAQRWQGAGLLEKVEAYTNKVGFSERTNVAIEPKLSMQWFLKMQHFADMALPPVMNDDLKFYPAKYKNTYKNWLENIKDWCISRQLWWGHRIPAYFLPEGGYVVAATPEEALKLAQEKTGNPALKIEDLRQDEDCLDTWFSSWLWPISLFDGILNPGNEEINYYYPTSDLVTGPDIIFFWVARMIMAGYEYELLATKQVNLAMATLLLFRRTSPIAGHTTTIIPTNAAE
jgi:valyl-tRNA synthetase